MVKRDGYKNLLLIASVVLGTALLTPLVIYAADLRVGDQPSVNSDEKVEDDVYIAGGSISSSGIVTGDVFAAGGSILISGTVGGDIHAGGGNVTILSNALDDVRVGGGNIVIQGTVAGDVLAGGGQVYLSSPKVGGDVFIGGGTVRIESAVSGDVRVGGGSVYINSMINGNVKVEADKLILGRRANIVGDLTYRSPKEMVLEEGAVVKGKILYEPRTGTRASKGFLFGVFSLLFFGKFFSLLVSALIIGLVFRRYAKALVEDAIQIPMAALGRGLVTVIVLPVVSILLIVTLVGAPIGVLGLVGFVGTIFFMWIIAPILLGTILYRWIKKRDVYGVSWKTILLGAVVYTLLGLIPFLGCIIQIAIALIALGAAVKIKWGVAREWR